MNATITDASALRSVTITDLAAYLRGTGWNPSSDLSQSFVRWVRVLSGEQFELDVPAREDYRDYPRRIAEALSTLAVAETRSQLDILQDIRRALVDVVRVRIEGATADAGRLSLDGGARVIGRVRDALLAAACAVVEPRAAFATRKPDAAMAFVRAARMAPPELGSFVIVVEAPLPPNLQMASPNMATEEPFERRATLLLARGLASARTAVSVAATTGQGAPFLDGVGRGLSSNLCDAVADIVTDSAGAAVSFRHSWASSRPVPAATPQETRFTPSDAAMLREGARLLRERGPQPDFELEGQIIRLDSQNPETGGVVTVAGTVDGRVRRVRVDLAADDYRIANQAHIGQRTFACEGELLKEGGTFLLRNPRRVMSRADS